MVFFKISISLFLVFLLNCGRKYKFTVSEEIEGIINYEGKPVSSAYITNITKKIRTKSDTQGRFSIQAQKGDEIIFESEDKSLLLTVGDEKKINASLEKNKKLVFYFKNFEPFLIQDNIFIFIPSTQFISPTLSDGKVIFIYPKGATKAMILAGKLYTEININDIEEFSFIDLKSLKFKELQEHIYITNLSDETAILKSYSDFSTKVDPGKSEKIPSGIYNIIIGDKYVLENKLLFSDTTVERGMIKKDIPMISIEGSAKTQTNEPNVLIWVEGTNIIEKSSPRFSIQIPTYSKMIYFSKAGWYPYYIDIQRTESGPEIELKPASYLIGSILTNENPPDKIQVDLISEGKIFSSYNLKTTEIVLIVPQGENFLLSVSATGYIPKVLELAILEYTSDIGSIYLCQIQDTACIIQEGKMFLKYGLYRKAREVFSYSQSVPAKSGLFISDIGIILSEEDILSLSEKAKEKSLNELSEIYDEIDRNSNLEISEPICFEELRLTLPILILFGGISSNLYGCVRQDSYEFFKSLYSFIKFLRNYIYSHKLPKDGLIISDLIDPQKVVNLSVKFAGDKDLLNFVNYDGERNLSNLKDFFEGMQKLRPQDCSLSDEIICTKRGLINIRTKIGEIPLTKPDFSPFINSILSPEEYNLKVSDIINILPISITSIPDFLRINLRRLLSNPIRKFLPAVLNKDSGNIFGIELEIPIGFKGINQTGFLNEIFVVGESKHFKVFGSYIIDYDDIYPTSSTIYFDDILTQEIIFYFYFDDPTFGNAIKISPCKLALTQKIIARYNCPNSEFYFPNNQMLNDVLAVVQKQTRILNILFSVGFPNFFNSLFNRM